MSEVAKKKRVIWEFVSPNMVSVSGDSTKAELEKQFSFRIERFKDITTHEETLKITSLLNGNDNGSVVSTSLDLASNIKQLMRYGVVLSAVDFRDIQKRIEENYLKLSVSSISMNGDARLEELIDQVKAYVNGVGDLITDDFCYVPVGDFNDLAEDCGFYSYEMKSLRSMLAKEKYIHVVGDRFAILKRIKEKPTRVVAFYREKLNIDVPVKKGTASKEMSGSDEE